MHDIESRPIVNDEYNQSLHGMYYLIVCTGGTCEHRARAQRAHMRTAAHQNLVAHVFEDELLHPLELRFGVATQKRFLQNG